MKIFINPHNYNKKVLEKRLNAAINKGACFEVVLRKIQSFAYLLDATPIIDAIEQNLDFVGDIVWIEIIFPKY